MSAISLLFITTSCNEVASESPETTKYVHVPPTLPEDTYGQLRPGDIILRKGNGPLSFHLMNNTKESYSHCGIVVNEDGEWKVIHTIGGSATDDSTDGIQLIDLDDFVAHAADSMLFICRPIFTDSAGAKVAKSAYRHLDDGLPFDHAFSLFTPDKMYCSELLYYIFKEVNGSNIFDVQKKHKSYMLMFSTFFHEDKFEPIFHLTPNKEEWYVLSE